MFAMEQSEKYSESQLFAALMENTADSIYFKDRECRLVRVNKRMAHNLGYDDPHDLEGKTDIDLFGQVFGQATRRDDLHVMETGQPIIGLIESKQGSDGEINWTSTTKFPLFNENHEIIGLLGITREINDLKQKEMYLEFLATHDILTALPNRYYLFDRLNQAIAHTQRTGNLLAVIYVDLDHFKYINDHSGHKAGDFYLVQAATILKSNVREEDTVARIGGDEFVILLENISQESEIVAIAERIITDFNHELPELDASFRLTPSLGICICPKDTCDASQLINLADNAMYQAKLKGNAYHFHVTLASPNEE